MLTVLIVSIPGHGLVQSCKLCPGRPFFLKYSAFASVSTRRDIPLSPISVITPRRPRYISQRNKIAVRKKQKPFPATIQA